MIFTVPKTTYEGDNRRVVRWDCTLCRSHFELRGDLEGTNVWHQMRLMRRHIKEMHRYDHPRIEA